MDHLSDAYARANRPIRPPATLLALSCVLIGLAAAVSVLIIVDAGLRWISSGCGLC